MTRPARNLARHFIPYTRTEQDVLESVFLPSVGRASKDPSEVHHDAHHDVHHDVHTHEELARDDGAGSVGTASRAQHSRTHQRGLAAHDAYSSWFTTPNVMLPSDARDGHRSHHSQRRTQRPHNQRDHPPALLPLAITPNVAPNALAIKEIAHLRSSLSLAQVTSTRCFMAVLAGCSSTQALHADEMAGS